MDAREIEDGALSPGTVVGGRYTITGTLAIGGMGVVHLGKHEALGNEIVIKTVRRPIAHDPEVRERFELEARNTAQLRGPHVVRVLDFGEHDGLQFLVMELLEGEDVADKLARERALSCEEVARILSEICAALAEAHTFGLVHRDLKPENVFLARDASGMVTVKVLDFGISKSMRRTGRSLTMLGRGIGSPRYMAPEQIDTPDLVDHRADVWALGVVGYEMLTGASPFAGHTISDTCTRVLLHAPAPISTLRADVWPELARFIERCLERRPDQRYQTMREARDALEAVRARAPSPGRLPHAERAPEPPPDEPTTRVDFAVVRPARWSRALAAAAFASVAGYLSWIGPDRAIAYGQQRLFELPAIDPPAYVGREAPPPSVARFVRAGELSPRER